MMKRLVALVLVALVMLFSTQVGFAVEYQYLENYGFNGKNTTGKEMCANADERAFVYAMLKTFYLLTYGDLTQGMSYEAKNTYVGYYKNTVYVVTSNTDTQRIVFEMNMDADKQECRFYIEDNVDMSQNEKNLQGILP